MTAEIGIVGLGHVGRIVRELFPDGLIYDINLPELSAPQKDVAKCKFSFICVPTDKGPSGHADLRAVEEVSSWLESDVVILRSTVPPGTSRRLSNETGRTIVFWPEFYGQWQYPTPWEYSPDGWPAVILGGEPSSTRTVVDLLAPRLGPMKTYRQTSFECAELCKYMENAWLAAQLLFAWQFRLLADAHKADFWEVRELWSLDPRVSKAHTATLLTSKGFDGKCLPKDLAAIIASGEDLGVDVSLLTSMVSFNEKLGAMDVPEWDP